MYQLSERSASSCHMPKSVSSGGSSKFAKTGKKAPSPGKKTPKKAFKAKADKPSAKSEAAPAAKGAASDIEVSVSDAEEQRQASSTADDAGESACPVFWPQLGFAAGCRSWDLRSWLCIVTTGGSCSSHNGSCTIVKVSWVYTVIPKHKQHTAGM